MGENEPHFGQGEGELGGVVDELTAQLGKSGYLRRLATLLEQRLAAREGAG